MGDKMKNNTENEGANLETYNSLAPKVGKEVDKDNVYTDALLWAIKDKDIKNIALTGIYGAGKSSVLEKFTEENKECYKIFNVSLASFDGKVMNTQNIEECILQQIFYQVDSNRIPHSRFKKISFLSKDVLIKYELLIYFTLILGLIIFFPNSLSSFMEIIDGMVKCIIFSWLYRISPTVAKIISCCLFALFMGIIASLIHLSLYSLLKNFRFTKFSLKDKIGFEIENDSDENKSIFNKYMDEIIYFFEVTDYDVFMFEDLDRFENSEIFIKLRELNTILNNYEKIKRKITFIYAIKDDIFTDKERTKFFDFIIPIIPFLNSSNSYEIMDELIKNARIEGLRVSDEYLLDVSPFIDDMRLLENITNEFKVYKLKLKGSTINDEKLLSMIIYKNICPKDFALLQNNKGFIYETLMSKGSLINDKVQDIDNEIDELRDEIRDLNKENLNNITDLERQFKGLILEKINEYVKVSSIQILYNGKGYTLMEFINSNDILYSKIEKLRIEYAYYSYGKYTDYFDADQELIDYINKLDNKKICVKKLVEEKINEKNRLILDLKEEKIKLEDKKYFELSEIIDLKYDEKYQDEQYNIAKFMLRRGYIDETFQNYISYFHEGNLSLEENNYVLAVKNDISFSYTYKLQNVKLILLRLDKRDFKRTKFYNVYILNYFLENYECQDLHFKECFENIVDTLSEHSEENYEFVHTLITYLYHNFSEDEYIKRYGVLIEKICRYWITSAFDFFCQVFENDITSYHIKVLVHEVLYRLSVDELVELNEMEGLKNTILQYPDFVSIIKDIGFVKIQNIIQNLDIQFKNLQIMENNEVVEFIFKNGYFEINENNMNIINNLYFNDQDFQLKNYTFIKENQCDWLNDKIYEDINKYVAYLIENHTDLEDTLIYIKEILSNDELEIKLKKSLIEIEKTVFTDWKNVETDLWNKIIDSNKIKANWENVLEYYNEFSFDEKINIFIASNKDQLIHGKVQSKELAIELLSHKNANLFLTNGVFNDFDFDCKELENSSDEVFEQMIKMDLLRHVPENYNALLQLGKINLIPEFLSNAFDDEFNLEECKFENNSIYVIFKSNLDVNIKKKIIQIIDFEELDVKCLNLIAYFVADYCKFADLNISKLKMLLSCLDEASFIHVINSKEEYFSAETIIDVLQNNELFSGLLIFNKRPKYTINKETYLFLDKLIRRGIVSSYNEKNGSIIVYPKKRL